MSARDGQTKATTRRRGGWPHAAAPLNSMPCGRRNDDVVSPAHGMPVAAGSPPSPQAPHPLRPNGPDRKLIHMGGRGLHRAPLRPLALRPAQSAPCRPPSLPRLPRPVASCFCCPWGLVGHPCALFPRGGGPCPCPRRRARLAGLRGFRRARVVRGWSSALAALPACAPSCAASPPCASRAPAVACFVGRAGCPPAARALRPASHSARALRAWVGRPRGFAPPPPRWASCPAAWPRLRFGFAGGRGSGGWGPAGPLRGLAPAGWRRAGARLPAYPACLVKKRLKKTLRAFLILSAHKGRAHIVVRAPCLIVLRARVCQG